MALATQFRRTGLLEGIDHPLTTLELAIQLIPEGHDTLAERLDNLGNDSSELDP